LRGGGQTAQTSEVKDMTKKYWSMLGEGAILVFGLVFVALLMI
jgi:hypothetical protein